MRNEIKLSKTEYFTLEKLDSMTKDISGLRAVALTGGRSIGKTETLRKLIKREHRKGHVGLYLRNSRDALSSSKQYFSVLINDAETEEIQLGKNGAGSISLCTIPKSPEYPPELLGYTLSLSDYESFKSSKRTIDYIIYEEFSTFRAQRGFNRLFALCEVYETCRQNNPELMLYAVANNLFQDDILEHVFDDKSLLSISITKPITAANQFYAKNLLGYLAGDGVCGALSLSLTGYQCKGYLSAMGCKVHLFASDYCYPPVILSDRGTGEELPMSPDNLRALQCGVYRSLSARNNLELAVGVITEGLNRLIG